MLLYLFYASLIIALLVVSFFFIEAWPFSAYPMFSKPNTQPLCLIFFMEVELQTGEKIKWKPRRPLFRKQIDSDLKSVLLDRNFVLQLSELNEQHDLLKKVITHFYQLYLIENNKTENVSKVNLIYQQVSEKGKAEQQQSIFSFTVEELNGLISNS